jgi:hypothetical protein
VVFDPLYEVSRFGAGLRALPHFLRLDIHVRIRLIEAGHAR